MSTISSTSSHKLNTILLRNLILPGGDIFFGQRMMEHLKFLEEAQWWNIGQINNYQNDMLSHLIKIAYDEVPFYRELLLKSKISPDEIRNTDDLQRLPIVTKEMLRKGYPKFVTRSTGHKTYEVSTSGSTGKNFVVREDLYTAGLYRATFLLDLEWAGWSIGDPHLQTGMTINRSLDKRLKDWALRCYYHSAYRLDEKNLNEILTIIEKHKIKFVFGYPGSIYYLAKYASKVGWNQPLRSVVTWGDMLYPNVRKKIEDTFQTRVFDTYGCGEGAQIAAQCEQGNYHIHALDTIVEFVDDNGKNVSEGISGNIVITRLHPGPMPLIRYSVGDVGKTSFEKNCGCGRQLPMMESIDGRSGDVITTPSGNHLIVHFFTGILEHFPEIDSFQVVQKSDNTLLLKIQPYNEIDAFTINEIVRMLMEKGCDDMNIETEIVPSIPLSPMGKHRFIINETNIKYEKQPN